VDRSEIVDYTDQFLWQTFHFSSCVFSSQGPVNGCSQNDSSLHSTTLVGGDSRGVAGLT
jgi:hypothetical protein